MPAGLSGVGPTRVEPQEAATLQQHLKPRTNPKNFKSPAAWMRRRSRNPSTIQRVFAHALANNKPWSRTPRQVKLPRQEAAGALVFARDASRQDCQRV